MHAKKFLVALIAIAGLAALYVAAPIAAHAQKRISMEQAIAIAEKHHPGSKAAKAEMDVEAGRLVYEVELVTADKKELDVKIDAAEGKVISSRRD